MINITEKASSYLVQLLSTQSPNTKIRVFVVNAGTPGVECGILYCPKNMVTRADNIYKKNGFELVVDRMSEPYLNDAVIDFAVQKDGKTTLTFKAPNLKRLDIPDSAPLRDKLENYFRTTINPGLATHGGKAVIQDVTPEGIVKITFQGGCKGCSFVNVTLNDGIETSLKLAFPGMVKQVIDVTDHVVTAETYKK